MIDTKDNVLFDAAVGQLTLHRQTLGNAFKGRFTQIFLGLKFYQNQLPSMFSGTYVGTDILQTMLDDLYSKTTLPLNESVLMLFRGNYLSRTGLVGPSNSTPQNTWRNNFNLQKGVGCYAPPADLASPTFLNQSRVHCKYLLPSVPGQLSQARCSLSATSATYRNEDHRKWLRIEPTRSEYALVDLANTQNFLPYLVPSGIRIPAIPLIVGIYHDADPGLVIGQRSSLDVDDFRNDFNFDGAEFDAYFDDDPSLPANKTLLDAFPNLSYNRATSAILAKVTVKQATSVKIKSPVLSGTPVAPPATNSGFHAEEFVLEALKNNGWAVYQVSRQQLGYDLLAKKGSSTRYVEVKSSLSACSPSLTAREWSQAVAHKSSYVLAIIENFVPNGANTIYWVPDPANSCIANPSSTINYAISRGSWTLASVVMANI